MQYWPFPAASVVYNQVNGINNISSSYTDATNIATSYNVWWGFTRFNFVNQASLHINSALTNTTIQGSSSISFLNLDFTILIFQFKECSPSTPYYM